MFSKVKGEINLIDYGENNSMDCNHCTLLEMNLLDYDYHALTKINLMGTLLTLPTL